MREQLSFWLEGAAIASSCVLALRSWKAGENAKDADLTFVLTVALGLLWFAARLYQSNNNSKALRTSPTPVNPHKDENGAENNAAYCKGENLMPSPAQAQYLIANRRSIYPRNYTGEVVPKDHVRQMLEAANWAPTHGLTEPWRFIVLEGAGKAEFEELTLEATRQLPEEQREAKLKKMTMNKQTKWPKVSHFIPILMKRQAKPGKLNPEWEEMCAVAAGVQNMQLAATALGVACYWSSWSPHSLAFPPMRDFLGLGEHEGDRCLGVLVVGRSDAMGSYRGSRKPIEDKVRWIS